MSKLYPDNPTTFEKLIPLCASLSVEDFEARLGGDVLIGRPDPDSGTTAWSFVTEMRSKDRAAEFSKPLFSTRAWILRPGRHPRTDSLLIGRAETNDIHLDHSSVSKLHARIRLPELRLTDAGSRNGTLVNDRPVGDGWTLRQGDEVEFGDCRLTLYRAKRLYGLLTYL